MAKKSNNTSQLNIRKTSDAELKAIQKYNKKFFMVRFRMTNDKYQKIKQLADKNGESIAAFFNRLADQELKDD